MYEADYRKITIEYINVRIPKGEVWSVTTLRH